MLFFVGSPGLPGQEEKICNTGPAEQIVDQWRVADQRADPERRDERVNGETCGNTGCCQQTCGPPPIEREGGEVRHIGPGRELKEQDDKDKLCQGAPALLPAS